jgi:hypothetical protein
LSIHEHYEELCALAAAGQASEPELEDLRSHLEACPSCRATAYDFSAISAQGLATLAAKRLHDPIPAGMTQRFLARARSEGIVISREARAIPGRHRWPLLTPLSAAGAVAAVVVVSAVWVMLKPHFSSLSTNHTHPATLESPAFPVVHTELGARTPDTELQKQLSSAQAQIGDLTITIRRQRAELESAISSKSSLSARFSDAEQQNVAFQAEKAEEENQIKQLDAELEKAKFDKNANEVAFAFQENELRTLRKQVHDQGEALAQQEALVGKGNDVRDLVVARNLHIIDVRDRDGDGKSQRTFGRIFYTEGKSLIFYAYDLEDPRRLDAKVSFYVWGERLGSEKPIRSLGIFHNDDASDGRWVLTFDDPRVLAQIDSVFVTAESAKKAVTEPRGQKILFAFLGGKPNHP